VSGLAASTPPRNNAFRSRQLCRVTDDDAHGAASKPEVQTPAGTQTLSWHRSRSRARKAPVSEASRHPHRGVQCNRPRRRTRGRVRRNPATHGPGSDLRAHPQYPFYHHYPEHEPDGINRTMRSPDPARARLQDQFSVLDGPIRKPVRT
jgi:hypothetical protein